LARSVLVHEWVGLLIVVIALASLAGTVWSVVQNAYFYECPAPLPDIPEEERALIRCPTLMERVGWNIPGLFVGCAILIFGLWTYRRGKEGVPLISVRSAGSADLTRGIE